LDKQQHPFEVKGSDFGYCIESVPLVKGSDFGYCIESVLRCGKILHILFIFKNDKSAKRMWRHLAHEPFFFERSFIDYIMFGYNLQSLANRSIRTGGGTSHSFAHS
jgi:hypothetical protein